MPRPVQSSSNFDCILEQNVETGSYVTNWLLHDICTTSRKNCWLDLYRFI